MVGGGGGPVPHRMDAYISIFFVDRQLGPGGTRLPNRHLGPG